MPHVLFAAPSIGSFHLHDRLAELAMRRGHRVTVLADSATARAFWLAQGLPVRTLPSGHIDDPALPLREWAEIDCRLAGRGHAGARRRRRMEAVLRRQAAGLIELFAHDAPDVVVMHQGRSGLHRLVHFSARRLGLGVIHLGEGMLPGTLVCDALGVDGDSTLCARAAADYRAVHADAAFLQAALAAWLGESSPPGVLRRPPSQPPLLDRVCAAASATLRGGVGAGRAAFSAWRGAAAVARPSPREAPRFPTPAIAVLLQPASCPRVRLDAPAAADARTLLLATRKAATALDPAIAVVGVLPDEEMAEEAAALSPLGCQIVSHAAANAALATALAVVTINHPLAGAALLHGTPVVHIGRAIYGVPGVTVTTTLAALPAGLARALARERPSLRERFLTRVLRRDHVWCATACPDRNGVNGLMQVIERGLLTSDTKRRGRLVYRPGPAWPLIAARKSR